MRLFRWAPAFSALLILPHGSLAQNAEQDIRNVARPAAEGAYDVLDGAIATHNGARYHNRPLYCNHMPTFVLAGDRPHLRLARDPYVYGCFMLAVVRDGKAVWLHEAADRTSLYHAGRMEWRIKDALLPEGEIILDAAPLAKDAGMAVRARFNGAKNGDRIIYAFGAATQRFSTSQPNLAWSLDPRGNASLLTRGFVPGDCAANQVQIDGDMFIVQPPAYDPAANLPRHTVAGRCSAMSTLAVGDASLWKDPLELARPAESKLPIAFGNIDVQAGNNEVFWAIEAFAAEKVGGRGNLDNPRKAFEDGLKRVEAIEAQVVVHSPDPRLDAAVAATCHGIDGAFYPPIYVHGGMLWNVPFPGWRTLYGPTAFGWHENVKEQAKYYISNQETDDTRRTARAEPSVGYGQQAGDSRFYGKGRIKPHNGFYNFQSQFFDMLAHAWRWTGDQELEKLLRPALEMHLTWQQECFDPDDDGLYESYINTWPTDSVWYAGGAGAEETSYAYTGHVAAADLAWGAGDVKGGEAHLGRAEKIRKAFSERFWIKDKGYPGLYIEQTGLQRLHDDSWLYSIFLPIDAGLLSPEQTWQALHYTEWGLQREQMPLGGERCWTSNWVPSVWSTRVLYPGDNYHLALAYFKSGLADAGWDLLRGAAYEAAYNGPVPGCPAISIGGTDFTDCTSMFARTVVEGLFGYRPDRGRQVVAVEPAFPSDWERASIRTPDFSLEFSRTEGVDSYKVQLTKPARIAFRAPVPGELVGIEVNGERAVQSVEQGLGHATVGTTTVSKSEAQFSIRWKNSSQPAPSSDIETSVGEPVTLTIQQGEVLRVEDPQEVLDDERIEKGAVIANVANKPGHHMVLAATTVGGMRQWHAFKLHVKDPQGQAERASRTLSSIPDDVRFDCVDMRPLFNGDIREIYKQEYLSPRPETCSVRIGSDGYSPWTFYYWNTKPPQIDLSNVAGMLDGQGGLHVPLSGQPPKDAAMVSPAARVERVPFAWASGEAATESQPANTGDAPSARVSRNIAFTSQWDNWPRSISVPIGRQGRAVWLLVCGTTNPMQTRIANGVIRLHYVDGSVDVLELVAPLNFWTLCPLGAADYDYKVDAFCLPKEPPATVQLGNNCRAMLLNRTLKPAVLLDRVELETLSPEVVIGLMGVTIMGVP